MEDMELWTLSTAQIVALASLAAATLGLLRQRGLLSADDVKTAFAAADKQLPHGARPMGSNLLTHVRMMAELAFHDSDQRRC